MIEESEVSITISLRIEDADIGQFVDQENVMFSPSIIILSICLLLLLIGNAFLSFSTAVKSLIDVCLCLHEKKERLPCEDEIEIDHFYLIDIGHLEELLFSF